MDEARSATPKGADHLEGSERRSGARPGGRTARVRDQVLAAVQAELVERSYDDLNVEAVAQRSGVHRATVYRRWGDVGGLLADTLRASQEDDWRPPDTGSLSEDLVALNRQVHAAFTDQPSISAALVAASFRSPPAAAALRDFWTDRYQRCEVVITRAVARGEVPLGTNARRLLIAATAPLYQHLILFAEPLPLPAVDQYALDVAAAARVGIYATG